MQQHEPNINHRASSIAHHHIIANNNSRVVSVHGCPPEPLREEALVDGEESLRAHSFHEAVQGVTVQGALASAGVDGLIHDATPPLSSLS